MAKVLLVEDEPDIRDLVRMALEMDAHEVSVAGTADEGLMRARDFAPERTDTSSGLAGSPNFLPVCCSTSANASAT